MIVSGGATRRQSVYEGLGSIDQPRVVIHDGARPFASSELVRATLEALAEHEGAIAAIPVEETLKRVENGLVAATVDRSRLWRAQTPQSFRTEHLRRAHERAAAEGLDVTDDAALIERYGGKVAVVEGSPENLKLTYAHDFEVAEAMLRSRSAPRT